MPALTKIKLSRSEEYWDTLDHGNMKQVLEAIMTEVISNQPELTARRANHSLYHPSTTYRNLIMFTTAGVAHRAIRSRCVVFGSATRVFNTATSSYSGGGF
jgi:hypothetical protein